MSHERLVAILRTATRDKQYRWHWVSLGRTVRKKQRSLQGVTQRVLHTLRKNGVWKRRLGLLRTNGSAGRRKRCASSVRSEHQRSLECGLAELTA